MSKPIKFVATVERVREVTLRGTADFAFWQSQLADYELEPADHYGRARILVIAASMRYMGMQFTEVSFSVEVVPPDQCEQPDAGFLIHAFNTSRMFAFSERVVFGTPYYHADCRLSTIAPISIGVAESGRTVFHAAMNSGAAAGVTSRVPTQSGIEAWEGPIFLPRKPGATSNRRYVFFGKLHGDASIYPYRCELDSVSIVSSRSAAVFKNLIDSGFAGEEWQIRQAGTHARSKTYPRK